MMKLTLKLLILMAILVAVAGLCGGWKWDAKPSTRKAAEYAVAPADPTGPALSASTDTSLTLAPADQNESDSTATSDTPVALTPGDEDAGSVSSAPTNESDSTAATDTPVALAPADDGAGSVSSAPTDTSLTPDGWTWD